MRHTRFLLLLALVASVACRHQDADDKVPMHMSRPSGASSADMPRAFA